MQVEDRLELPEFPREFKEVGGSRLEGMWYIPIHLTMNSTPRAVFSVFWILSLAVAAGVMAEQVARADGTEGWEFQTGGLLDQVFSSYLQPVNGYLSFQDRADAELSLSAAKDGFKAQLTPWVTLYGPYGVASAANPSSSAQPFFDAKEGWVEYKANAWDVRLGNQIIAWGAADRVNPTDLWNPLDLADPFQSRKLPVLTARAGIHPADVQWASLELLFSPFFRQPRLPVDFPDSGTAPLSLTDSRWLMPFPDQISSGGVTVPLNYQIAAATLPQQTWQGGARLRLSPIEGWDFDLSYYTGVEKLPRFHYAVQGSAVTPDVPVTATLFPSFHREQVFGVDGSGAILDGKVTLRFEVAYHLPDNSDVPLGDPTVVADLTKSDFVHGVAGLDYTLPWKLLGITTYLDASGVVYQTITPQQTAGATVLQNVPDVFPWDRDVLLYMENRFSPRFKLQTTWIWSLQNQDGMLTTGVAARIGDHFNASVDGDFFLGSQTGFYGQFYDDTRVRTAASYAF